MKGKVIRGKGFRGVLEYLLAILKNAKIISGNLFGHTPWTLSKEFAVVRQLLPDCEKPVLHIYWTDDGAGCEPRGDDLGDRFGVGRPGRWIDNEDGFVLSARPVLESDLGQLPEFANPANATKLRFLACTIQ